MAEPQRGNRLRHQLGAFNAEQRDYRWREHVTVLTQVGESFAHAVP